MYFSIADKIKDAIYKLISAGPKFLARVYKIPPKESTMIKCVSSYNLQKIDRLIFAILYLILGIVMFFINVFVVHIMVVKKMYKKPAFQIIFVLTILQILNVFVCPLKWTVMMFLLDKLSCVQSHWLYQGPNVICYLCHATILFLSLDRFLRVNFMKVFGIKISQARYYFLYSIYVVFTIWQCAVWEPKLITTILLAPDVFFIFMTLIFYVLSIIHLRDHQRKSKHLCKSDRDITRLSKIYLLIIVFSYLPHIASLIHNMLFTGDEFFRRDAILKEVSAAALSFSGIANGLTFIMFVTKGKKMKDVLVSSVNKQ